MKNPNEPNTVTLAETENFIAWSAEEPDGETTTHLEINALTVHFFMEEWQEFLELRKMLLESPGKSETLAETPGFMVYVNKSQQGDAIYNLELDGATLHFLKEDWDEFMSLVKMLPEA